ncbi:hypothetical protein Ac42p126 [Acinetobacter phage Ac42]|uniref:hypothetical protein n=1 Tax=Acinetobacter phage Ac42 TaxID=762660 RepID=UPI0001EBCD55|nr:hypothetical protein Ac42p126 [Acinetobacter phage Ac42]ADI96364.1 hypothetical protein Ac42p126 [Acinetobacter phage Ac42]
MELLENTEYNLLHKSARGAWETKHIIMVNGATGLEARSIGDYYGPTVELDDLDSYDVSFPYSATSIDFIFSRISKLYASLLVGDAIKEAKFFAEKYKFQNHVHFGIGKLSPESYIQLEWLLYGATKGQSPDTYESPFTYKIGQIIELQSGKLARIEGRSMGNVGYETIFTIDEEYPNRHLHKYDRSSSKSDAGRATGSCHQYTNPNNVLQPELGNRYIKFVEACKELNIDPKRHEIFVRIMPRPVLDTKILELIGGCMLEKIRQAKEQK